MERERISHDKIVGDYQWVIRHQDNEQIKTCWKPGRNMNIIANGSPETAYASWENMVSKPHVRSLTYLVVHTKSDLSVIASMLVLHEDSPREADMPTAKKALKYPPGISKILPVLNLGSHAQLCA